MTYDVIVRRQDGSKRFGIYGVTVADDGTRTEELLEGGFFARENAEVAARDYRADMVAKAERRAGWDPNP